MSDPNDPSGPRAPNDRDPPVSARDQDARVRSQYEAYPYPERDPADEARRLITGSPSHLLEIEHFTRAGRPVRNGFRALVAGGGTGDAAIMLAQQLATRHVEAEVVHLDLSDASRAVAQARTAARGLTNLRFVAGAIEDAATVAPGPWDYIDCCGVLHHLASPEAGLAALVSQLAPTGGLGLMVYGTLGRRGVYDVQDAMAALAPDDPEAIRLALARRLVDTLPQSHWLTRNPFVRDHLDGGDAGLYDLLLHRRDRSYTVPELLELLGSARLTAVAMIEPARYDPATYLRDDVLIDRASALPRTARWALAEQLSGSLTKHIVYAVPEARSEAAEARPDGDWSRLAPVFRDLDPAAVASGLSGGAPLKVELAGHRVAWPLPPDAAAIARLVDGATSLAAIRDTVGGPNITQHMGFFLTAFHGINRLLLRDLSTT